MPNREKRVVSLEFDLVVQIAHSIDGVLKISDSIMRLAYDPFWRWHMIANIRLEYKEHFG